MKIGFIGLGIMGGHMAANLLKQGFELIVYNRSAEKAQHLLADGASWADSAAAVAEQADILITMLATPEAVRHCALGQTGKDNNQGFLQTLKAGSLWIDCSTGNPMFSREMASLARQQAIRFLDAPVAGSRVPAQNGELVFFIGGEQSDIAAAHDLFTAMGKATLHLGQHGQGSAYKLVNNYLLATATACFAEVMAFAKQLGLDTETTCASLLASPLVPAFMSIKHDNFRNNHYPSDFPLKWMQKDMQMVAETAFANNSALPIGSIVKEVFRLAQQQGLSEQDFSAIFSFYNTHNYVEP